MFGDKMWVDEQTMNHRLAESGGTCLKKKIK